MQARSVSRKTQKASRTFCVLILDGGVGALDRLLTKEGRTVYASFNNAAMFVAAKIKDLTEALPLFSECES